MSKSVEPMKIDDRGERQFVSGDMASSHLSEFPWTRSLSFHLQGAARARQTFASDPRSGWGAAGLRVADLQAGMGSVRSRRYYPAYSIRKRYKSPLRTTHDEEMERRRRLPRRETSSWPTEPVFLLLVRAPILMEFSVRPLIWISIYYSCHFASFYGYKRVLSIGDNISKILFFLVWTEDLIQSDEVWFNFFVIFITFLQVQT